MMNDPFEILNRLDSVRAETLKRFENNTQDELDWKPPHGEGENQWSLGEVFMHLAGDEHYLREQIARPLLEGIKPPEGIHFIPPPPPYGAQSDASIARKSSGRFQPQTSTFRRLGADERLRMVRGICRARSLSSQAN